MGARMLKDLIVELTRGGCRIESLAHDPVAVTFRSPDGARCALAAGRDDFRLIRQSDEQEEGVLSTYFPTLRAAVRAACAN